MPGRTEPGGGQRPDYSIGGSGAYNVTVTAYGARQSAAWLRKNGNISDFGQPAQPGRPGRGPARKSFQVQEEDLSLSEDFPAAQWRFFSCSMQTFRFPKTFPRISLISLPEAATLHPATENPTGSLAAPRTAGTLPEQPDHPPPGSAVTVTLCKPEPPMRPPGRGEAIRTSIMSGGASRSTASFPNFLAFVGGAHFADPGGGEPEHR